MSVIVPCFNAAPTVRATLTSALGQSLDNLEIVVVDDGSTDDCANLVAATFDDPRLRVIRQENSGVAAARNRGIAEARGQYIAPLDADDLWHRDKLALQVACFDADPSLQLVYCWYAIIDELDRMLFIDDRARATGDVARPLCERNFIGNGSVPLVRRAAAVAVGGYDSDLHKAEAQGSEDWLFYSRVAEQGPFGLVPEILVAYRETTDNMSSRYLTMLRSRDVAASRISARNKDLAPALSEGRARAIRMMLARAFRNRQHRAIAILLGELAATGPRSLAKQLGHLLLAAFNRARNRRRDLGIWNGDAELQTTMESEREIW